jgi:glutathione S-transferase
MRLFFLILMIFASFLPSRIGIAADCFRPAKDGAPPPRITILKTEGNRYERIVWLMEELKLPYKIQITGLDNAKKVSTLVPMALIDDCPLFESGFALDYILEHYGKGLLMPPKWSDDYWNYRFYMYLSEGTLVPRILPALVLSEGNPEQLFKEDLTPGVSNTFERLQRVLKFLEKDLEGRKFISGQAFSLADIMMYVPLKAAHDTLQNSKIAAPEIGEGFARYPNIAAYYARLMDRPAFHKAYPPGKTATQ